jgi:hypothetical protein
MTLTDHVWKLWVAGGAACGSAAPAVFSGDGRTFKGAWQGSAGGSRWKHDFDLNYLRPGQLACGRSWIWR